eukprot:contig_13930_g3355
MPGLRDMYEGWAAEVEQLKLQRARLTADIEDVVVLRGAPLVSVLRRLNLMRSAAASLVGVSDQLYQPHPTNTFGRVALADECIELWEGVVRYVVNWDRFKSTQEDKELRRGISYILASPGRGKTLYLREAMRYYYSNRWRKAQPELDQLVVMCVSFNGYVEPTPADLKAVQQTKDPRVMLYTRLVLCQLAEFGDRPDSLFRDFAAEVAADLEAGRFHHAHMEAEVERMITDRCRGRSLLLLVDEINKVGPGSGGGGVSEELGADAREILRSEGCRLASTIGEGSACYTSLERALMQAETSVSGRPGYPIGTVQLARAEDHVGMMVARLTAQQTDGGLWGSAQASLIAMYSKDELLQYVFLFPANFQAYDAVCFYEAESSIVGTLAAGDLVVLLGQAKHIGLDRVDKTGWSAVQKCVTGLEKADKVLGDKDFCAAWHQRLVYVYFSNQEFSSTKAPLTGPWAPRTVILGRDDIARLFGNLVCCLSKIIGLPLLSDKGD